MKLAGCCAGRVVIRVGNIFAIYRGYGGSGCGADGRGDGGGIEAAVRVEGGAEFPGEGLGLVVIGGGAADFLAACGGGAVAGVALAG